MIIEIDGKKVDAQFLSADGWIAVYVDDIFGGHGGPKVTYKYLTAWVVYEASHYASPEGNMIGVVTPSGRGVHLAEGDWIEGVGDMFAGYHHIEEYKSNREKIHEVALDRARRRAKRILEEGKS
ncbi:MAG TPA: hypothetical protein VE288_04045 [Rubrobacteraceae bacterium]|nr:hypothetical protein [Rubrobacteraceae bacterium]